MEAYAGTISPPAMYVRALYDYNADDDSTSLSFQAGDIIQVLTQLESGWWDGIIHGTRGWFPSNYCMFIADSEAHGFEEGIEPDLPDTEESEGDQDEHDLDAIARAAEQSSQWSGHGRTKESRQEEAAAFWIPQATPDGRLFYYNTLTGVKLQELPLESPTSATETGPKDHTLAFSTDARPPPEMMAGGYETEDDASYDHSASDAEESAKSKSSFARKRSPYMSEGASPGTSMESLVAMSAPGTIKNRSYATSGPASTTDRQTDTLAMKSEGREPIFDDENVVPLTWNRVIEDMRKSIERYRQVIMNGDRADFVRRAEDISDHLRLLLAAASGTTDNHSGNPSVVSTNKALYPPFRDMMSRFSKLVLSSHIAAADWPSDESHAKCLQEADGVLGGVYGFAEVARQQRGEEIVRVFPGFHSGKPNGANWQNNGLAHDDRNMTTSFIDNDDSDSAARPFIRLDSTVLRRLEDHRSAIITGMSTLESNLALGEKQVDREVHRRLSVGVCGACTSVIQLYQPWLETVESIDFSAHMLHLSDPLIVDFLAHKQRIYNLVADLVVNCQSVAGPLADEWTANRGDSLEQRLDATRAVLKELEAANAQTSWCLQQIFDSVPQEADEDSDVAGPSQPLASHSPARSRDAGRSLLGDISLAVAATDNTASMAGTYSNAKIKKFFGDVPSAMPWQGQAENAPAYLRLDHEAEVQYDSKPENPSIVGGTLTGLVEQLTRHDRYDSTFASTFLLTYQSFTTAAELFEMLVRRWNIQPGMVVSKEEFKIWAEQKQAPIRFRIVNVLKMWFDSYWLEGKDEKSQELVQRAYEFASDTVASAKTPGLRSLILVIGKRLRGEESQTKRLVPSAVDTPTPILPRNMKKLKFQDIDPTEFARQLTSLESRLYGKIKPQECLNKTWQKKLDPGDPEPAPNVKALILHSNKLTNWVAEMILTQPELKKRAAVIKQFVQIADKCHGMSNFSTLTSIISALGSASIHRLNRTWTQVSPKTKTTLEKLRILMHSTKNFAQYREALHSAQPPCIPFFGVYLTDLTFIEDGIPGVLKNTDLINFAKRAKTAEVIREVQQYQNTGYPFRNVAELQSYILGRMQDASDVHEMYDKSLEVEPREREDEKIARLLSESGFL